MPYLVRAEIENPGRILFQRSKASRGHGSRTPEEPGQGDARSGESNASTDQHRTTAQRHGGSTLAHGGSGRSRSRKAIRVAMAMMVS